MRRRGCSCPLRAHRIGSHWPSDVLDQLVAHILETVRELVADLVAHDPRDADPARLGQRLQPRRNVDAIAVDVVILADDVAEIDADAELDSPFDGDAGIAFGHRTLHLDRTMHRVDDAGELDEEPVTGGFDDADAMLLDSWVGDLAPPYPQRGKRSFLVLA